MERKDKGKNPGTLVARWTHAAISLLVGITSRGVRSITLDSKFVPGQEFFWTGIEPVYADLTTVEPFGTQLADELDQALSGQLVKSKVPWVSGGPPWHLELYRYVCGFASGQVTILPDSLNLDGEYRQQREMVIALRKCALVPLVPLHRVATTTDPMVFPWGDKWRSFLLRRERRGMHSLDYTQDRPMSTDCLAKESAE